MTMEIIWAERSLIVIFMSFTLLYLLSQSQHNNVLEQLLVLLISAIVEHRVQRNGHPHCGYSGK